MENSSTFEEQMLKQAEQTNLLLEQILIELRDSNSRASKMEQTGAANAKVLQDFFSVIEKSVPAVLRDTLMRGVHGD